MARQRLPTSHAGTARGAGAGRARYRHWPLLAILAVVLLALPSTVQAQRRRVPRRGRLPLLPLSPALGPRLGYDFGEEGMTVGAELELPLHRRVGLIPSADLYFLSGRTAWQANLDAALRVGRLGFLYTGGGLALGNRIRDRRLPFENGARGGADLFVGIRRPGRRGSVRPYVQGRWTFIAHQSPFQLLAGVDFPLRR